jgi:Cu-Zn family superoxide dismutase
MAVAVFRIPSIFGEVEFTPKGHHVLVKASFEALPKGKHGFHIHKAGDLRGEGCQGLCDHWHKGAPMPHGGEPGETHQRHTGDMGNLEGKGKNPVSKELVLHHVRVEELWGRSVVIHEDEDDLGLGSEEDSQTTGHSGKRIGCAIIGRLSCSANAAKVQTRKKKRT